MEERMNGIEGIKESSMNKNGRWNEMENESEQKSVEQRMESEKEGRMHKNGRSIEHSRKYIVNISARRFKLTVLVFRDQVEFNNPIFSI